MIEIIIELTKKKNNGTSTKGIGVPAVAIISNLNEFNEKVYLVLPLFNISSGVEIFE